jgi:peptide-methionine (S)-S-oxide reductase
MKIMVARILKTVVEAPSHRRGGNMLRLFAVIGLLVAASGTVSAQAPAQKATAIFAGGCFWCTEADFDKVPGVISTTSGYIGGKTANPSYEQVSMGNTGHAEAVQVVYDPGTVSYEKLLDVFWRSIDPLVKDQQFCDHGDQYRSAIFYGNEQEKQLAEGSKKAVEEKFKPRAVFAQIVAAGPFYKAEEYHQDYYTKNPVRYKFYRYNCGRDQRLEELWGKNEKSS